MWNVKGLHRKLADTDFLDFLKSYNIVFLCETWASEIHLTNLSIQGFESVHGFGQKSTGVKKGRLSGGSAVYYKNELKMTSQQLKSIILE